MQSVSEMGNCTYIRTPTLGPSGCGVAGCWPEEIGVVPEVLESEHFLINTDMKKLLIILAVSCLTACSTVQSVKDMIPSFWDDNQSKVVTDLQLYSRRLDCSKPLQPQLESIEIPLQWLTIYSQTKNTKDVLKLTTTFTTTYGEFKDRVNAGPVSPLYCDIKQKLFVQQADMIAKAVQGRF